MNVLNLSEDEDLVYKSLSKTIPRSSGEITEAVPFGKSKTTAILKKLVKTTTSQWSGEEEEQNTNCNRKSMKMLAVQSKLIDVKNYINPPFDSTINKVGD